MIKYIEKTGTIVFTFNDKTYTVQVFSNIIRSLSKNPNFNLVYYLCIKLGYYLKELQVFLNDNQEGENKVYIPLKLHSSWYSLNTILDKLKMMYNCKPGFWTDLHIIDLRSNKNFNIHHYGCIQMTKQTDRKTVGLQYTKYYLYKDDKDWGYLFDNIYSVVEYLEIALQKFTPSEGELSLIQNSIDVILQNDLVKCRGKQFLRGLFYEYTFNDEHEHLVAINHLKILDIPPSLFIENINVKKSSL